MSLTLDVGLSETNGGTVFSTFDAELPLLAAKAAMEVEFLRLGKQTDLTNVQMLVSRTSPTVNILASASPNRHLVDPVGDSVFAKAFASLSKSSQSAEQLELAASKISEMLSQLVSSASGSSDQLMQARDFCGALSRYSTVAQAFVAGDDNSKPNRK